MTNKSKMKSPVWLLSLIFAYSVILVALTVLNLSGADRWWFGALNLYLPQMVWAIPGILLATVAFKLARHWVWLPLLGIVWVVGPLMGLCWPLPLKQITQGGLPLRVMTWNVKYGSQDKLAQMAIKREIDLNNPAVVLMQDAGGLLDGPLGNYFKNWSVRSDGQYIIASKLPLDELQVRRISFPGEAHSCVRTQFQIGGNTVALYNVHFESPRWGLNALRAVKKEPQFLPIAIQKLENNVAARFTQVQALREYISREQVPVIIAGDLNSPYASRVCATLRTVGLHDAFAEGGKGYGYTYGHFLLKNRLPFLNFSWMRIDHIMMSSQFHASRCWTGTGEVSAHRPVIADLVLVQN